MSPCLRIVSVSPDSFFKLFRIVNYRLNDTCGVRMSHLIPRPIAVHNRLFPSSIDIAIAVPHQTSQCLLYLILSLSPLLLTPVLPSFTLFRIPFPCLSLGGCPYTLYVIVADFLAGLARGPVISLGNELRFLHLTRGSDIKLLLDTIGSRRWLTIDIRCIRRRLESRLGHPRF